MPFTVKKSTPIKTGNLGDLGQSVIDLAKYTEDEFGQVAKSIQSTEADKIWNVAPPRPRRGTIAYADGTHWNPGFGEGPYYFNGSVWTPMFTPAAWQVPASWLTAWTSYTPSVSALSGAFTGTATGRYKVMGKTCFLTLQFNTATMTTAGYVGLGLPFTANSTMSQQYFVGREMFATGNGLTGWASGNTLEIALYNNNASVQAANWVLVVTGLYETT